ncbi:MAG: hypothetical protein ACUVS4_15880 [Chloroflexaceae bacterium]
MDQDLRRRLVYGLLNLLLGLAAAWLATYLTNKILGAIDAQKKLEA